MKRKLEEKWSMMRWLVQFIEENKEQWRIDKEIRQNENWGEILITQSVDVSPDVSEINLAAVSDSEKWDAWREKAREKSKKRKNSAVRVEISDKLSVAELISETVESEDSKGMELGDKNVPKSVTEQSVAEMSSETIVTDDNTGTDLKGTGPSVAELSETEVPELSEPIEAELSRMTGEVVDDSQGTDLGDKNVPLSVPELSEMEITEPRPEILQNGNENREAEINRFRNEIREKTGELIPPSRTVVKIMNKFYRRLEESVWRMSALGCVDEEDDPELSVAELSETEVPELSELSVAELSSVIGEVVDDNQWMDPGDKNVQPVRDVGLSLAKGGAEMLSLANDVQSDVEIDSIITRVINKSQAEDDYTCRVINLNEALAVCKSEIRLLEIKSDLNPYCMRSRTHEEMDIELENFTISEDIVL